MNVLLFHYAKLDKETMGDRAPHEPNSDAFAVGVRVVCRYGNAVVEIRQTSTGLEVIAQSSSYAAPAHLVVEDMRPLKQNPICKTCDDLGYVMTEGGRATCECQFVKAREVGKADHRKASARRRDDKRRAALKR